MDIANASMYDGSTGAAEAVMMAVRVTGRNAAVIACTVHPEYREVLATYAQHQGIPTTEVAYSSNGRVDLEALDAAITSDTACVLIQSPNFFGTIEDVAAVAAVVHSKGALLIVSIAEAVSLGIVKPPVEADIVSLEAQELRRCRRVRRTVLRRHRSEGEVPAADAGPPLRSDGRHGRPPRLCADAFHA